MDVGIGGSDGGDVEEGFWMQKCGWAGGACFHSLGNPTDSEHQHGADSRDECKAGLM